MPFYWATARPGSIILGGVFVIAIVLGVVVTLPLLGVDRELGKYIPPKVREETRSVGDLMAAASFTTTQDMTRVIGFYSKKLKLGRHLTARSGMMMMTRGRIFGGHHSDAVLPMSGAGAEAMTIVHRERRHLAIIAISRGQSESTTSVTVLLERLPEQDIQSMWQSTNAAAGFLPPYAKAGSSGMGLGLAVAESKVTSPVEEMARHYATELQLLGKEEQIPNEVRRGDGGLVLRHNRAHAESILLANSRDMRQSLYVFCFRDNASTQTLMSVSWVAR